jgi:flagellar assembly protein FliH
MKSSAKRARAGPGGVVGTQAAAEPFPFRYYEVALPARAGELGLPQGAGGMASPQSLDRETQGREAGRQQGEREARAKFEEQLARERAAIVAAVQNFAAQRTEYYRRLEQEAVQLALSIARKVLHREALADPLLLMGVAQVALGKIESTTKVILAVNPQKAAEWRRYLAANMEAARVPEIVEDVAMAADRCELRTALGTAQLGIEMQLKEIEQGLADLLAARPGAKG